MRKTCFAASPEKPMIPAAVGRLLTYTANNPILYEPATGYRNAGGQDEFAAALELGGELFNLRLKALDLIVRIAVAHGPHRVGQ
jgi:hypothetical protein